MADFITKSAICFRGNESIRYLESIVVFVEDEFAASGCFAEAAFFNDVLDAEVTSGAYIVFEDR